MWDAVFHALCSDDIRHILPNVVESWVFYTKHEFANCSHFTYYACFYYFNHNENLFVYLFYVPLSHFFRLFPCLRPGWLIWPRWQSWFHTAGEATTPPCWWESSVHLPRSSQNNKLNLQGTDMFRLFYSLVWWQPCVCVFLDTVMLDKILASILLFLRIWI